MEKKYLLTPGPTPIPKEIIDAMAKPIIHHRTPQYTDIVKGVNENLREIFKTKNNVLTFTSSGTGAMEASVINTLSKNDTAIVVRGGKFGERFTEICNAYGVNTIDIDIEWGTSPDPSVIADTLKGNPNVKAVFMQLCETSTATVYDVKAIGNIVKETNAILVVDAISGLGADDFNMDEWNVDVAIGGSQKAFMIPPGLSFCSVSEKAWRLVKASDLPKYYFDLNKYNKLIEKSDSPWTPAITLTIGLEKALSMIKEEGVDNFIKRHKSDAKFVQDSAKNLGLQLFSKSPSYAVTAINIPSGVDVSKLIKALKAKGITFAGGQGNLKGKIIRIAHMGGVTKEDLEHAIEELKKTLKEESVKA
jgi:serine---pyruvate transaminase